jgi:hypothetical protein
VFLTFPSDHDERRLRFEPVVLLDGTVILPILVYAVDVCRSLDGPVSLIISSIVKQSHLYSLLTIHYSGQERSQIMPEKHTHMVQKISLY